MPKITPPPPVAPESWRALLAAASDFATLRPWEFSNESDTVGLVDSVTGEVRIGHVLGNGGEVFAAVFYRRSSLRWILSMLGESYDPSDLNNVDGMDSLMVEFVTKRDIWKEDLAALKTVGFKPAGKGPGWPQFRSSEPGWHPWHINQAEADQLLADLPRLTAFCKLLEEQPDLFEDRSATEIPFLPAALPNRPLMTADLDWRPLVLPPLTDFEPFQVPTAELEKLRALKHAPGLACEFDCTIMPGGSFEENGRPCFGRLSLLVKKERGLVIGMDVETGGITPGEAAGRSLIKALLMADALPEKIFISGSRFEPVLEPLCAELQIQLWPVSSLPALEEAMETLSRHMLASNPGPL